MSLDVIYGIVGCYWMLFVMNLNLFVICYGIIHPSSCSNCELQMDAFKNARGLFGLSTAIMTRSKKNPAD
ncbi:unnamed protein product [Amaranthus hypochondriacus]